VTSTYEKYIMDEDVDTGTIVVNNISYDLSKLSPDERHRFLNNFDINNFFKLYYIQYIDIENIKTST